MFSSSLYTISIPLSFRSASWFAVLGRLSLISGFNSRQGPSLSNSLSVTDGRLTAIKQILVFFVQDDDDNSDGLSNMGDTFLHTLDGEFVID